MLNLRRAGINCALLACVAATDQASAEYVGPSTYAPFTANNGATVASSEASRWGRVINVVDDFGARGDGSTDDWAAIQRAMGMNSSGVCAYTQPTLVVVPPTAANAYRVAQAIRLCSYVTLWVKSNATTIRFTGDASGTDYTGASHTSQWPVYGGIIGGTLTASSTAPTLTLTGGVQAGQTQVTLATPANASNLVTNDIVDIETTSNWTGAGTEPTAMRMAKVVSANATSGLIQLDRPVDFASASIVLRRLTNGASTGGWPTLLNTGIAQFATHDCAVIGGQWIASSAAPYYQPFMSGGGGLLDCTIDVDTVYAGVGLGGNAIQDSVLKARHLIGLYNPSELAYQTQNTRVEIGTEDACGSPATIPPKPWDNAFDEGSHRNVVRIGSLNDCSPSIANLTISGTVTGGGGDVAPVNVFVPAVSAATINGGGTGFGNALTGTLTYSGSGCSMAPVLNVTSNSSGVVSTINFVQTSGYCTAAISSSATTWTVGGGLNTGGSGASFVLTMALSYAATYTSQAGDGLTQVATGLATALNAVSGFSSAGFTATGNPPNGSGTVLVANSSPSIPFYVGGGTANSLTTYMSAHDIIRITDASANKMEIGSISGGNITGQVVDLSGLPYTGTAPSTNDNDIAIETSTFAYQYGDISVGGANAANNVVHDGWYHGSSFSALAFQYVSGVGAHNIMRRLNSDAFGDYLGCGQSNVTNVFDTIYTQATTPLSFNGSDQITPLKNCSWKNITSDQINALSSMDIELFQAANVTNSGSVFLAPPNGAAALGQYFGWQWDISLNVNGTNATKPISLGFWGCTISLTVPQTATGIVTIKAYFDAYGATGQNVSGFAQLTTTLGASSDPAPASCSATTSYSGTLGASVTLGPTGNAGDNMQIRHVWGRSLSPFERISR